mgnify:CR=1 FL=1
MKQFANFILTSLIFFTTIKVSYDIKNELDKVKQSNESYNTLLNRLIKENEKLNKILLNIENLREHIQEKEPEP